MSTDTGTSPSDEFNRFVSIVHRLRRECPWDREQTHLSIRDMLIEEAYEVVETIDEADPDALKKELGDLLLHVAMHARIAEEEGAFDLRDVLREINEKLIRRHPHVFGTGTATSAGDVKAKWEEIKMAEGRASVLDGVPKGLPALQHALKVQERAARVGFDWKNAEDVWKKVTEELGEMKAALRSRSRKRREEELGDFLFSLVNYSRFIGTNPESALRVTIRKFIDRFRYVETELERQGKKINRSTLEEMDALWTEAKKRTQIRRRKRKKKPF
jgi:MazG family protein